ncbi:hypothetical protein PTTW11_06095 [Pyrenophora teres f. teres]|uniref:Uncharacterized protein n=1 Tax=Pyrenophora teres f. teres TaxID=97479 RepID=A0A6S6W9J2_9PLEO|nr:hypothetical protein PTTW11_06095 [Pyrenophora teres f. teres]
MADEDHHRADRTAHRDCADHLRQCRTFGEDFKPQMKAEIEEGDQEAKDFDQKCTSNNKKLEDVHRRLTQRRLRKLIAESQDTSRQPTTSPVRGEYKRTRLNSETPLREVENVAYTSAGRHQMPPPFERSWQLHGPASSFAFDTTAPSHVTSDRSMPPPGSGLSQTLCKRAEDMYLCIGKRGWSYLPC